MQNSLTVIGDGHSMVIHSLLFTLKVALDLEEASEVVLVVAASAEAALVVEASEDNEPCLRLVC